MAFKYSDYLFTPSDIFRGILYVLKNLRTADVVGEAFIFLILIFTKQVLGWGEGIGLLVVSLFVIFYWTKSPGQKILGLFNRLKLFDIVGAVIIFLIFIFTMQFLGWEIESIFFLIFFFSLFYWNLDARISIALALLCLVACPILLFLSDSYILLQGEEWAEQAAIWTYFFLFFGVAKQIWDFRKEGKDENDIVEAPKPIIGINTLDTTIENKNCSEMDLENDMRQTSKDATMSERSTSRIGLILSRIFTRVTERVWYLRKEIAGEEGELEWQAVGGGFKMAEAVIEKENCHAMVVEKSPKEISTDNKMAQISIFKILPILGTVYKGKRENRGRERFLPQMMFFVIVCAVMLPVFFQEGYIFLLDMVWGPNIQLGKYISDGVTSGYPLMLLLKLFSSFVSTAFLQKALLSLILYLSGYLMFTLSRNLMPRRWAILSGIFYMLNPYVFERLLAGQWLVLLGYAVFPLVISSFLQFLKSDKRKDFWMSVSLFSIYPLISLHWAYIAFWFMLVIAIVYLAQVVGLANLKKPETAPIRKKLVLFAVLQGLLLLIVNSFWLKSFLDADGTLAKITSSDFQAFSTMSDPVWGAFFNVLSLYGFWQDSFFLPKDIFPYWWVLTLVIIAFSFVGFINLAKKNNTLAISLGIIFLPAALIATGYATTITWLLTDFLFRYLPGFAGMRETAKVTGVLAFSYALFFPLGVKLTADWISRSAKENTKKVIYACSFISVIMFCYLLVNNMFFGFKGQLRAYQYPDSWYEVEETLNADTQKENVLFLPWHGYPELDFAGKITAANPARSFFTAEIISGKNLDSIYIIDRSQMEWDERITEMLQGKQSLDDNIDFLRTQSVDYIVLAKTADWQKYGFLDESARLQKVFEAKEIFLYKVLY